MKSVDILDTAVVFQPPPGPTMSLTKSSEGGSFIVDTPAERGTFIALRRLEMRGYRAQRICTNANESPWHDGSVTFLRRNYS